MGIQNVISIQNEFRGRRKGNVRQRINVNNKKERALRYTRKDMSFERGEAVENDLLGAMTKVTVNSGSEVRGKTNGRKSVH